MSTTQVVLLIVAGVVLLGLVVLGFVLLIIFLVKSLSGAVGGWSHLVAKFGVPQPPPDRGLRYNTVQIGAVVYKRCVTLWITEPGLYVQIWRKTALIPWAEFRAVGEAVLYWQKMPLLTVGEPPLATLTLPHEVFRELQTRLPGQLRSPGS